MNTTILENSYCGYRTFLDSILTPIFGNWNIFAQPENQIDGSFSATVTACIQSVYKVADIRPLDSSPIELYDVTVKDSVNIANARVGIRELIKRLEFPYTHAFILFHYANPNERSWRFSYLFKEGTQTQTTNAKRYTYVFGPNCPCRTAKQRFDKLANAQCKSDDEIKEAFSVEALSREFFDEYKEHYADFVQYVTGKRIVEVSAKKFETKVICEPNEDFYSAFGRDDKRVRDYVKKMMGRLVFLCFIQRKGWLNNDPYYLQNLFANSSEKEDFLDAVLEPMFFGLLNTKPQDRKKYFDEHNWDISLIPGADNIPYLNGGLFEADENDAPPSKFPLELFSNTTSTTIQDTPKKYRRYEKNNAADIYDYRRFRGLFDFFAAYNFTIDENDPNDAEIGVDPEMLGKIFENLLEDNKDKGAYYTPKEIVQYMCRESLIAYLTSKAVENNNGKFPYEQVEQSVRKLILSPEEIAPKMNDRQKADFGKAIREVKICDPAIGSGAFPMGLLNELVRCRVSIGAWALDVSDRPLAEDYASLKREIVCNNIYGVDIEKGAIDIARLRFWLSIVVDMKEPAALPNFDYKFMQGNSLITTFAGEYINLSSDQQHTNIHKMRDEKLTLYNLKKAYYTASGEDKHRLSVDIKNSIIQLISLQLGYEARSWADSHAEQLSMFPEPKQLKIQEIVAQLPPEKLRVIETGKNIRSILNNEAISLEDRAKTDIQFFDWRMMFTEVFEGDNSGFDIVIGNPPYIKEYENKDAFNGFRESSPYYMGKMDLWHGFACHGLDLTKENGILSFIAQNNWTTNGGSKLMRTKIVEEAKILQMVDFNDYMVFGESASIQTMIMLFAHNSVDAKYKIDYRRLSPNATRKEMLELLSRTGVHTYLSPIFMRALFRDQFITFSDNDDILRSISKQPERFNENEVAQGIVFPQDFLNRKGQQVLGAYKIGDGIFGLTDKELKELNLSNEEKQLIKPYYTSDQIHRYYTDEGQNTLWMIYTGSEFNKVDSMDGYPKLKSHIDKFLPILTSDNKPYGLHRARKASFFCGEKIISLRKCVGHPCFSYSNCDCYVTQTYFSIKTDRWDSKFLTGLLNSKLIEFWLHNKGKMQGENFQIDKEPLLQIPLPDVSCNQNIISTYVDQILSAKKSNPNANTSDFEKRIDDLVYELYGLSDKEKEIVRHA